jgi:hypothetical protein
MESVSLQILTQNGTNHLSESSFSYRQYVSHHGRPPTFADLPSHQQNDYNDMLRYNEFIDQLKSRNDLYIVLNSSARKGSIARIVDISGMVIDYQHRIIIGFDSEMTIAWDDGKVSSFKINSHLDNAYRDKSYHEVLFGYRGPTVYKFTKTKRVAEPIPVQYDRYGNELSVGTWIMDQSFHIGKITRISPKGTLWIDYVAQKLGPNYQRKVVTERFGRNTYELLKLELPEGFEVFSTIMDRDVTNMNIIPTFRYEVNND